MGNVLTSGQIADIISLNTKVIGFKVGHDQLMELASSVGCKRGGSYCRHTLACLSVMV